MSSKLIPATERARALLEKLQALADRGIDGERSSAQSKIARLKARYDFGGPSTIAANDLFFGSFKRAKKARLIYSFAPTEFDVASSVKWAIESATKIPCIFRDGKLLTEATAPTARRLVEIAEHIAGSFRALLAKLGATDLSISDRAAFVMGLYDGMMNETRSAGHQLPSRAPVKRKGRRKAAEVAGSGSLHVHPYTLAVPLGRQIRFSAPVEQITAELEAVMQKNLTNGQSSKV